MGLVISTPKIDPEIVKETEKAVGISVATIPSYYTVHHSILLIN